MKRAEKGHKDRTRTKTTHRTEPEPSSEDEDDDWRCIAGWSQEDHTKQQKSSLRAEAMEFQPYQPTEIPEPEEKEQTWWPWGVNDKQEVAEPGEVETLMSDPEAEEEVSPDSAPARQHPSRIRHAPKIITYNTRGQPVFS